MGKVIPLMSNRPAYLDLKQILIDFTGIGLYHASALRDILTANELREEMEMEAGVQMVDVGEGWFFLPFNGTAVSRTAMRLAAVTEERVIPYKDVAEAFIKMIEWGPEFVSVGDRRAAAARWGEYFEILPSREAVIAVAHFIGATDTGNGIDFSTAPFVIEPNEVEEAVLNAIEMQLDFSAPSSLLCREARKRLPENFGSTIDYRVLKGIAFILKPERENNRLIGFQPDPRLSGSQESGMVGFLRSIDGNRFVLEYVVTELNVEGNSFNVPSNLRSVIAGNYLHKETETVVKLNLATKTGGQKITGIGAIVRAMYPDYITGQKCFILLDKVDMSAQVKLVHVNDFDEIARIQDWVKAVSAIQVA